MSLSIETLALSRKYTSKVTRKAFADAIAQSEAYTNEAISKINSFNLKIVDTLPTTDIDPHTMYLVPRVKTEEINSYYEYFYIQGRWELVGTTEVDLSGYYTKEEVNALIEGVRYTLPIASKDTLGGVKVDEKTIVIDSDGTISVKQENVEEIIDNTVPDIINQIVPDIIDSKVGQIESPDIESLFTK